MIFKVNIGTLTNTVGGYGNTYDILIEQNTKVNSAITELTDLGWSGTAKEKFLEAHKIRQEKYVEFEKKIKFVRDILQDIEKTKAVYLKTLCENFVNYIERISEGGALTGSDVGTISFNGEPTPINRNVDNCINDDYNKISSNMNKIMDIVDNLEFTSFGVGKQIASEVETSIKNQTTSLTDFKDVFNTYYNRVEQLENGICSAFQHVSGVNEGSFKSSSVISPSGEIAEDQVLQIMLKNPKDLKRADKEILQYANVILGEEKYLKDYNETIGNKLKDLLTREDTRTLTEDDIYYLETVRDIIGADKYNKLAQSIGGNIVPPENIHAACDALPHAILVTQEDLDSITFALEANPVTAPVGFVSEEASVGSKYLKSVLSKASAIGKEEEIVADVSKIISEAEKINEISYVKSSEIFDGVREAGGLRQSALREVTPEEIEYIKNEFEAIGGDPNMLRFNKGSATGYSETRDVINVRGDIFADLNEVHPRSTMSERAVLAHEYYGHAAFKDVTIKFDTPTNIWYDEFRASYTAAKNAQNLSDMDRYNLIQDAICRAQESGVQINNNDFMRSILYGY